MEAKEEIETGNKLIAEFMGGYSDGFSSWIFDKGQLHKSLAKKQHTLLYHESWDWLMPVIIKIENFGFEFFIHSDGAYMRRSWYRGRNFPDFGKVADDKITAAWTVVVEFIKWKLEEKTVQSEKKEKEIEKEIEGK